MPQIISIDREKCSVTLQHMDETVEVIPFNELPCDYSEYLTPPALLAELAYEMGVRSMITRLKSSLDI